MSYSLAPRRSAFYAVLLAILLLTMLGTVSAAPPGYPLTKAITAAIDKGDLLQGDGFLPVFQFATPTISDTDTYNLAQQFEGIFREQTVGEDDYLEYTRFTIPNTETNSILEQYGATGGFYAYRTTGEFGNTGNSGPIEADRAEYFTCLFLLENGLFPDNVAVPDNQNCDFNAETTDFATVSLAHATNYDPETGETGADTVIAASTQVTLSLNLADYGVPNIPLGGPGGHISLLFRTTDYETGVPTLDDNVPGLAAVSMPFYGRQFDFYGSFPAVDAVAITQQIQAEMQSAFPNATAITVPDPVLRYMVNDAAMPQKILEPELVFEGIEVVDDGNVIRIKAIEVPATEGVGPSVAITAPANGTTYMAGDDVSFTGVITPGGMLAGPYTYTWSLEDGTVLMAGTVAETDTVAFTTDTLPVLYHDSAPAPVTVYLSVEDANGVERQTFLSLQPTVPEFTNSVYLAQVAGVSGSMRPTTPMANYSYGSEAASDYPPLGSNPSGTTLSDLPSVPNDASGFRNGLAGLGWDFRFHWSNASVWEKDWRDCSLGGGDCSYGVDRADFVYYSGHGGGGGLALPSSVDSTWFSGTNARYQNIRWIGFASCQTLRAQATPAPASPIVNWFDGFQGAHMFLGFNSDMKDLEFGGRFVDNMRLPKLYIPGYGFLEIPWAQRTIADAWVQTAFQLNAGKPSYLFAIGTNGVNPELEKLPKANDPLRARPFPVASYNWVWWDCGEVNCKW